MDFVLALLSSRGGEAPPPADDADAARRGAGPGRAAAPRPSSASGDRRATPEWRVFQLKRGHRFSNDDLLTAWARGRGGGGAEAPAPARPRRGRRRRRARDARLPPCATPTLAEAKPISAPLCRATLARNARRPLLAVHADLRELPGPTSTVAAPAGQLAATTPMVAAAPARQGAAERAQ